MNSKTALESLLDVNFIEYASYVIKERAIPHLDDGLKPVQRRILHTLFEVDDGRFHKVANIVGHTMRYHPHGDASIEAALVNVAQKGYLIDQQGNFGNILTGDPASAARYIECRLSKLARENLFNPEITDYVDSYDGRNREPVALPAKLPLLLMAGAEGIAVGLSTKILPHNFIELLQAQVAIIKGEAFDIFPDFTQGGIVDISQYNKGLGRVRIRARVEISDAKSLVIREIPYGTTTESLIASIEKAIHKGKLKISAINDFTTEHVEIELKVGHGAKAEDLLPRLFLYSDCEVSAHVNAIVIKEDKPVELSIDQILEYNTAQLVTILELELRHQLARLKAKYHNRLLTQFFIENKLYLCLEKAASLKELKAVLLEALLPFNAGLEQPVSDEDVDYLLGIPIKRISKFDRDANLQEITEIEKEISQIEKNLADTKKYAIKYLRSLMRQYEELFPRRTQVESFESIDVAKVAVLDLKVGYDPKKNYVGLEVKDENPILCSSFDKLLLCYKNGTYTVIDLPSKLLLPKKPLFFDRLQNYRTISAIYEDPATGRTFMKRFLVRQFILDKEYHFIPEGARLLFFSTDDNPIVQVDYVPQKRSKLVSEYIHLGRQLVKSVSSIGNRVADRPIARVAAARKSVAQLFEGQSAEIHRLKREPEPLPSLFDLAGAAAETEPQSA